VAEAYFYIVVENKQGATDQVLSYGSSVFAPFESRRQAEEFAVELRKFRHITSANVVFGTDVEQN